MIGQFIRVWKLAFVVDLTNNRNEGKREKQREERAGQQLDK